MVICQTEGLQIAVQKKILAARNTRNKGISLLYPAWQE